MGRGANQGEAAWRTFTRQVTDEIKTTPLAGEVTLVSYQPGRKGRKTVQFLVSSADIEKAGRQSDPITYLTDKADHFDLLKPDAPDLLGTVPFERTGWDWADLFVDDLEASIAAGDYDPERVLSISGEDFSHWRPGVKGPVNRPFYLEMWGTYFDLDRGKEILDEHPWVISAEIKDNRVTQNWDISGRRLLDLVFKMPDERFDAYERWVMSRDDHGIKGHLPFRLNDAVLLSAAHDYESDGWLPSELADPFGLKETAITNRERSSDEDDDGWDH